MPTCTLYKLYHMCLGKRWHIFEWNGRVFSGLCYLYVWGNNSYHKLLAYKIDSKLKIVHPLLGDICRPITTILVAIKNTDWQFLYWYCTIRFCKIQNGHKIENNTDIVFATIYDTITMIKIFDQYIDLNEVWQYICRSSLMAVVDILFWSGSNLVKVVVDFLAW